MPVDCFMRACLEDPVHGYLVKPQSIGAGGDFVTAPEIGQVFGELVGLWGAVAWQGMGGPAPLRLVELGPGRGTLMRDALRAARVAPDFLDAVTVHLVEVSPPLRRRQQQLLGGEAQGNAPPVAWHAALQEVPAGPAIVIGNEFLDALPIRQLVWRDAAWHERVVDAAPDGTLRFATGPAVDDAPATAQRPEPGAIAELRPGEDALLAALAARPDPVVALLIDYGPAQPRLGDTLQAVRGHACVDPLAQPGTADLTAHVQFSGVAAKARGAGLAVAGPITQAELLGRLGIAERTARLMAANPARAGEIELATQRLMSPTGMGQLFKAIAVLTPGLPPPPAFG
jgi:NADH dehydrogenase [ubiquinone] 1 alpha subcomplex assembly factor 7